VLLAKREAIAMYVHVNKTYFSELNLHMLKESHRESDLLQQCRQVVIFEKLGTAYALVEQQIACSPFLAIFHSILVSVWKLSRKHKLEMPGHR